MPLLSVVIPTRNRQQYLLDSVSLALASLQDAEVIVCDNSDDDRLRVQLADMLATGRVHYQFLEEPLSVVGNFEKALAMGCGDYVVFIGDDDAVGPGLEEIARWAQAEGVDAVVSYRSSFLAYYFWPGVKSKYFGNAYDSHLFVRTFDGRCRPINAIDALTSVASRLGGGLRDLPRAYHGLVSRRLIERIQARHGHLFGGVSPDIYSATLIAANCEKAVIVDYPFVIPGAAPASAAGQGAERSDRGNLRATEHIARFGDGLKWDARIPAFYSPHTVWAYSFCKALEQVPQLQVQPAYGQLYASCLLYHRSHHAELREAMRALAQERGMWRVCLQTAKGVLSELARQAMRLGTLLLNPRAGGSAQRYGQQPRISDAFQALGRHIQAEGIELQLPRSTQGRP
jgi:hypothetical protein